jgi:hypothetical protein
VSVVRLELAEASELFVAPPYDPLSGRLERQPGVERLLRHLQASRPPGPQTLEIVAAETRPAEVELADIRKAVSAFCRAETDEARDSIRLTRRRGLQALWIGLPALAVCLAASGLSSTLLGGGALGNLLSNSFVIAGWVAMWRPAELLLYEWWPFRQRIRHLEQLSRMEIRLIGN